MASRLSVIDWSSRAQGPPPLNISAECPSLLILSRLFLILCKEGSVGEIPHSVIKEPVITQVTLCSLNRMKSVKVHKHVGCSPAYRSVLDWQPFEEGPRWGHAPCGVGSHFHERLSTLTSVSESNILHNPVWQLLTGQRLTLMRSSRANKQLTSFPESSDPLNIHTQSPNWAQGVKLVVLWREQRRMKRQ